MGHLDDESLAVLLVLSRKTRAMAPGLLKLREKSGLGIFMMAFAAIGSRASTQARTITETLAKPLETVPLVFSSPGTQLKLGVNEKGKCPFSSARLCSRLNDAIVRTLYGIRVDYLKLMEVRHYWFGCGSAWLRRAAPYRRVAIGGASNAGLTHSFLAFAECNSALQQIANLRYDMAPNLCRDAISEQAAWNSPPQCYLNTSAKNCFMASQDRRSARSL